jgi:pimeloyl-ACP methyl ester carboxylesterase
VLWLGGGLEVAQGGYLINPFEYESFGTIRFLQDLSKYYCLLVLQHGSSPSHDFADRTIFQEPIQGQPTIAREAHDWLTGQGYGHIVLMGYSVGAEAAAAIAVSDPGEWTGKDGLILITARLPPNLAGESPVLNTNLMLLYGHAPTFEPSGQRFYQLAPAEGWHGAEYLHKEYHVLDQMSHEVWSPLANNTYSPQLALGTIVNFIQTFIALQFGRISLTTTKASYTIESVQSPQTVMTGAPFIVDAQLSELNTTSTQGSRYALVALLNATVTLTSVELPNPTRTEVQLLVPPIPNASRTQLAVLVVTNIGNQWMPASSAYPIAVTATNDIELTINGLIGNTTLKLDNSKYDVPNDGTLTLNTTVGNHMIQTLTGSHESSVEYAFVEWNDGNTSATRILTLTHDTTLTVTYHTQYFVNVTSPFGVPEGAGWYDTNSTIIPTLAALPQPTDLFQYWSTAIGNCPSGAPIQVNSPMTVNAIWAENSSSYSPGNSWLPVSILAFLFMLLINRKLSRARKSV